jgi:hypothetical protein
LIVLLLTDPWVLVRIVARSDPRVRPQTQLLREEAPGCRRLLIWASLLEGAPHLLLPLAVLLAHCLDAALLGGPIGLGLASVPLSVAATPPAHVLEQGTAVAHTPFVVPPCALWLAAPSGGYLGTMVPHALGREIQLRLGLLMVGVLLSE